MCHIKNVSDINPIKIETLTTDSISLNHLNVPSFCEIKKDRIHQIPTLKALVRCRMHRCPLSVPSSKNETSPFGPQIFKNTPDGNHVAVSANHRESRTGLNMADTDGYNHFLLLYRKRNAVGEAMKEIGC